jgi:hypothetical protein
MACGLPPQDAPTHTAGLPSAGTVSCRSQYWQRPSTASTGSVPVQPVLAASQYSQASAGSISALAAL